jgi:exodeoxyribonuclease-1
VYKNQSLWLRLDVDDILGLDADVDIKDTFVIRKRPADALIVLPALERFWNKLPGSSQQYATSNIEKIRHHWKKLFEFIQYYREFRYAFIPNMDPDATLYQDGFFSALEKKQIALFHKTQDHKKYEILEKIESPRIKILAGRILARNFKAKINQADQTDQTSGNEYHSHIIRLSSPLEKNQIIGYKNDRKFNCRQGLQELKEVEQEKLNPNQKTKDMLRWIKKYIENL